MASSPRPRWSKVEAGWLHNVGGGAGSGFGARVLPKAQGTHKGEESSRVYAIVRCGGRQEKVALDDVLTVDKLAEAEEGSTVTFPALLVVDGETVITDASGYTVTAEVVGAAAGPKINMIHYKNKSGYKRRQGHRQKYTQVRVTGIEKA
jgi:large subunit ribosomal protein L21